MLKRRNKDDGFTLVELMIVIAVIGILAVVLVPRLGGVRDSAKEAGVITNAKSVEAYAIANFDRWIANNNNNVENTISNYFKLETNNNNALSNPFKTEEGGIGESEGQVKVEVDDSGKNTMVITITGHGKGGKEIYKSIIDSDGYRLVTETE